MRRAICLWILLCSKSALGQDALPHAPPPIYEQDVVPRGYMPQQAVPQGAADSPWNSHGDFDMAQCKNIILLFNSLSPAAQIGFQRDDDRCVAMLGGAPTSPVGTNIPRTQAIINVAPEAPNR